MAGACSVAAAALVFASTESFRAPVDVAVASPTTISTTTTQPSSDVQAALPASIDPSSDAQSTKSVEVPEPASMLLLGTGLVGLAGLARRRLIGRQ